MRLAVVSVALLLVASAAAADCRSSWTNQVRAGWYPSGDRPDAFARVWSGCQAGRWRLSGHAEVGEVYKLRTIHGVPASSTGTLYEAGAEVGHVLLDRRVRLWPYVQLGVSGYSVDWEGAADWSKSGEYWEAGICAELAGHGLCLARRDLGLDGLQWSALRWASWWGRFGVELERRAVEYQQPRDVVPQRADVTRVAVAYRW